MGAEDIRACIKFIEEQTGAKWSWDAYFSAMKRFNEETRYELEKWEVNKTAYPQIIGPSYELFRKWNYEMDGGIDPRVMKTCRKVNKLLMQSYERRDEAWVGKMRYRGIVWSCPAHYYANFSNWLANCWGINILVEMESLNFTKPLETRTRRRRCAIWPVCTSAWSCAVTPTAATRTWWTSCGVSARRGTPTSSSCTRTWPARTWPPYRAFWTSRAASAATT